MRCSIPSLTQWAKDPALLWLWGRPAAVAPIGSLAWQPPYAVGMALNSIKESNQSIKIVIVTYRIQIQPPLTFAPTTLPLIHSPSGTLTSLLSFKNTQHVSAQGLLLFAPFGSFFFFFFRATPAAYGSSQARGQIRATAASLLYATATATWDPSRIYNLHHNSQGNTRSLTH